MAIGQDYTPFSAPLARLDTGDLAVLRTVREGWYIEYKEEVPKAAAIAKSVSAFANTYGGLLFYGIREESKENPVAGQFVGLPSTDVASSLDRIRQAIAAHSSPVPFFETFVFHGPCDELGLEDHKAIICLDVPSSLRAPHVHKSGVIYRRVADGSEPTAENDRHALGELFRRSEKLLKTYRQWFSSDPAFREQEKSHPYLRILVSIDPWCEKGFWFSESVKVLRDAVNPSDPPATLPFDTVVSTRDGFLLRQSNNNDLTSLTLTWALRRDLVGEVLIPIPVIPVRTVEECISVLDGYDCAGRFAEMLSGKKFDVLSILDLNQLYLIFKGWFEALERIFAECGWGDGISLTFKILNADRACPFLDVERVISRFETIGVPVIFDLLSPLQRKFHPDALHKFDRMAGDMPVPPYMNAVRLLILVCESVGLPLFEDLEDVEECGSSIVDEVREAGWRGMEAQRLRGLRTAG